MFVNMYLSVKVHDCFFSYAVACDVANCVLCTQEKVCRECDDGFELITNGDGCVDTQAESAEGAGLNVPVIAGMCNTLGSKYRGHAHSCSRKPLTQVYLILI